MLPLPVQASPRFPVRALFGHCFYRRIIIWAVTCTFFLCLIVFSGGVRPHPGRIIDHIPGFANGGGQLDSNPPTSKTPIVYEVSDPGHDGSVSTDSSTPESASGMTSNIEAPVKTEQHTIIEQNPTNQLQPADPNGPHWLKYQQ